MQDSCNPMESYCFKIDLASLIDKMPEPDRELCRAAMQGKTIREISEQLHIHPRTARRRIKKALAPLAAAYGIRGGKAFSAVGYAVDACTRKARQEAGGGRFSGGGFRDSTTGEVIKKGERVSFSINDMS